MTFNIFWWAFYCTKMCEKSKSTTFYSKMWNSSFCREGCGLTGAIWITSYESESGTLNTFQCFRKLPQSSVCKWQWKWKDVYFSVSGKIFQKWRKKMWDKVVQSLSFRPFPFPLHAGDHHGLLWEVGIDLIVLLVQMTTMVFWSLLNLFFVLLYKQVTSVFNDYPYLEIFYRWKITACTVAAGWTRCLAPEVLVVVFKGAFQYDSCL